ncbi:MAG: DUF4198 domain-containing protein [Planktomarina sp.]
MIFRSLLLCLSVLIATPLYAHEFWIDPAKFQVSNRGNIQADFRVGQGFSGSKHSFLQQRTTRHQVVQNQTLRNVSSRSGDRPAFNFDAPGNGLLILIHETANNTLRYTELAKFEKFATHKAFDDALTQHQARGLPDTGFVETYRRYAKSLIAVGDGTGQDQPVGLDIEIVALANPYIDDVSGGLPVQVLLNGAPRANVQVELFARATGSTDDAIITLHTTDARGVVILPVKPGQTYMADNVALQAVTPTSDNEAVWHTLWANLTFAVPG